MKITNSLYPTNEKDWAGIAGCVQTKKNGLISKAALEKKLNLEPKIPNDATYLNILQMLVALHICNLNMFR